MRKVTCLAVAWILILQVGVSIAADAKRPNVLLIAIDDLSDYVSILQNHPGIKTPNFDRMAKRAVNFTRAYCAAPICNPSRTAFVTGLAPHVTGVYQNGDMMRKSKSAVDSIPLEEQFKRHGYETLLTGKYYHAMDTHWWPEERLNAIWTERRTPFSDHGPMVGNNKVMGGGIMAIGPAPGGMSSMPDIAILENTKAWLSQEHQSPFFLVHGISKPHLAFVVPQEFFDLYPLDSVVVPETIKDDYSDIPPSVKTDFLGGKSMQAFAKIRKAENGWKEVMQAYLASISFCDWVVGQILDELESSPFAENTIVVLWSDHGYNIGEKEWMHKRALWTQTTRVPLMISLPGMKTAGEQCAAPVSLLDMYPTLVELCDLSKPVPQKLSGHSLVGLLNAPSADWPHSVVTSHDVGNAAVTDARYHYIHYADGSEELYDHQDDPREYRNLASEPQMQKVIDRLKQQLPQTWTPASSTTGKKGQNADE